MSSIDLSKYKNLKSNSSSNSTSVTNTSHDTNQTTNKNENLFNSNANANNIVVKSDQVVNNSYTPAGIRNSVFISSAHVISFMNQIVNSLTYNFSTDENIRNKQLRLNKAKINILKKASSQLYSLMKCETNDKVNERKINSLIYKHKDNVSYLRELKVLEKENISLENKFPTLNTNKINLNSITQRTSSINTIQTNNKNDLKTFNYGYKNDFRRKIENEFRKFKNFITRSSSGVPYGVQKHFHDKSLEVISTIDKKNKIYNEDIKPINYKLLEPNYVRMANESMDVSDKMIYELSDEYEINYFDEYDHLAKFKKIIKKLFDVTNLDEDFCIEYKYLMEIIFKAVANMKNSDFNEIFKSETTFIQYLKSLIQNDNKNEKQSYTSKSNKIETISDEEENVYHSSNDIFSKNTKSNSISSIRMMKLKIDTKLKDEVERFLKLVDAKRKGKLELDKISKVKTNKNVKNDNNLKVREILSSDNHVVLLNDNKPKKVIKVNKISEPKVNTINKNESTKTSSTKKIKKNNKKQKVLTTEVKYVKSTSSKKKSKPKKVSKAIKVEVQPNTQRPSNRSKFPLTAMAKNLDYND